MGFNGDVHIISMTMKAVHQNWMSYKILLMQPPTRRWRRLHNIVGPLAFSCTIWSWSEAKCQTCPKHRISCQSPLHWALRPPWATPPLHQRHWLQWRQSRPTLDRWFAKVCRAKMGLARQTIWRKVWYCWAAWYLSHKYPINIINWISRP